MASSITLYEITKEGQLIHDCLIDSEGEITPEIEERLDLLLRAGSDKLEAASMVLANLETAQSACKAEAKRLSERAKNFESNAERLKARMVAAVDAVFGGKVKTDLVTVWTQKSPDTQSFDLAEECTLEALQKERPDFVRSKLELNRAAIKTAYDAGQPLPDSIFVDRREGTRYLRVK
jgi:hypothetical protein